MTYFAFECFLAWRFFNQAISSLYTQWGEDSVKITISEIETTMMMKDTYNFLLAKSWYNWMMYDTDKSCFIHHARRILNRLTNCLHRFQSTDSSIEIDIFSIRIYPSQQSMPLLQLLFQFSSIRCNYHYDFLEHLSYHWSYRI